MSGQNLTPKWEMKPVKPNLFYYNVEAHQPSRLATFVYNELWYFKSHIFCDLLVRGLVRGWYGRLLIATAHPHARITSTKRIQNKRDIITLLTSVVKT